MKLDKPTFSSTHAWIERCKEKYGNRFDYSLVEDSKATAKVKIRCVEHDEIFEQRKDCHLSGDGCPSCKREKINKIQREQMLQKIKLAKEKYGDRFDYSQALNAKNKTAIRVRCVEHDEWFEQYINSHLKYNGCKKCKSERARKFKSHTIDDFVAKSRLVHGDRYDYRETVYENSQQEVKIRCIEHDLTFEQLPVTHLQGYNACPICTRQKIRTNNLESKESWVEKCNIVHKNKYDYTDTILIDSHQPITIRCKNPDHGVFSLNRAYYHTQGGGCPKCVNERIYVRSKGEIELFEFVQSVDVNAKNSERSTIFPLELDVVSHKHKLAIEYNGLYWHSSGDIETDHIIKSKHIFKTERCANQGFSLFHIFEHEWEEKREIVKSMISHRMNANNSKKIYARKCELREINQLDSKQFLDRTHLQGSCRSTIQLGLYFESSLVSVMTFGVSRFNRDKKYELLRFSNELNTSVIGGASKLFKYFTRNYSKSVISYANKRFSNGNLYEKLGFEHQRDSKPCYWWVVDRNLCHRSVYMKHMLSKKLKTYDENKTEIQNMYDNKFRRIWDCGNKVYYYEEQ